MVARQELERWTMARVKRLNEAGLRRLVRGMLREMGEQPVDLNQVHDRVSRMKSDYFRTLESAYGDYEKEARVRKRFARMMEEEIRPLLPMLDEDAADVRVFLDSDEEYGEDVEIVRISVLDAGGLEFVVFDSMEDLIDSIERP
jgi:hypothetical protein